MMVRYLCNISPVLLLVIISIQGRVGSVGAPGDLGDEGLMVQFYII